MQLDLPITSAVARPCAADALTGYGLRPVELSDRPVFNRYFASLASPLSDYTFSQIYTWRNSLHLVWAELSGHLCVFANGSGDLTLLVPPIGDGRSDLAQRRAFELMDDYNAKQGCPDRARIEYASEELLGRLDRGGLDVVPMGTDYIYDVHRMVDLAGGDLASKRQAKNRFCRLYQHRVETYDPARHLDGCLALLDGWRVHQDAQHLEEPNANAIKRQKESIATALALRTANELGLKGMVVYVDGGTENPATHGTIRGFTLGEYLDAEQSSIVIEKTDLEVKGLAQFIFSEFCRQSWTDRPLTNVGDDWGLESLAWTKMSYRPTKLLQKYTLAKTRAAAVAVERDLAPTVTPLAAPEPVIRLAVKHDLAATVELEKACFSADFSLKKRQLQYLQQRPSALFLVAEQGDQVIGQGIALLRHHRRGGGATSGRIYSLAVDDRHRGRRVGKRLLQTIIDELAGRGASRAYLEVERTNAPAVALYEQLGFRSIGTLHDYYGPGRDAVHMMRELTARAAVAA